MESNFNNLELKHTGPASYFIDPRDSLQCRMGTGIFWDDFLQLVYSKYLNKDSVFVDAGAFVGQHTMYCSKICSLVYAFEIQPIIFCQLCANLLLNNCKNVVPLNLGLWNETTKFKIQGCNYKDSNIFYYDYKTGSTAAALYAIEDKQDGKIPGVPLDALDLGPIHLIKMDCQGSDYNTILGARETIKKYRPVIAFEVEVFKNLHGGHYYGDYVDLLKDLGYETREISSQNYLATPK